MSVRRLCDSKCAHLRSFRYGFGGERFLAPFNGRDRLAACAIKQGEAVEFRPGVSVCWRGGEEAL
jgi:hypothetical protein